MIKASQARWVHVQYDLRWEIQSTGGFQTQEWMNWLKKYVEEFLTVNKIELLVMKKFSEVFDEAPRLIDRTGRNDEGQKLDWAAGLTKN